MTPYMHSPAGFVCQKEGVGWYIYRLDYEDNIKELLGPIGTVENAIQASLLHFQKVYLVECNKGTEDNSSISIKYTESTNSEDIVSLHVNIEDKESAILTIQELIKQDKNTTEKTTA